MVTSFAGWTCAQKRAVSLSLLRAVVPRTSPRTSTSCVQPAVQHLASGYAFSILCFCGTAFPTYHLRAVRWIADVQAYKPTTGAVPVGMAILPENMSAYDAEYEAKSTEAPWLLLVTAKVREQTAITRALQAERRRHVLTASARLHGNAPVCSEPINEESGCSRQHCDQVQRRRPLDRPACGWLHRQALQNFVASLLLARRPPLQDNLCSVLWTPHTPGVAVQGLYDGCTDVYRH